MARKTILSILLIAMFGTASQSLADPIVSKGSSMPVSQHYLTDEYVTIRDFHKRIGEMIKANPNDKALLQYALRVTQSDLAAVEDLTPPENYIEMKDFMANGLRAHVLALQLYLQGNQKEAKKQWDKGNAQFQWVNSFLAQRDWDIDTPPTLDPNYKPTDIPLTAEQYADRYFLLRMTNDPDICTQSAKKRQHNASLNRLERRLQTEKKIWNELQYPPKMQPIHDQVVQVIQGSMNWVQLVRAGKNGQARKQEAQIQDLYKSINTELTQDFKINIPSYCQVQD